MSGANIVVHCAAIAGIDMVITKPTETMRVNMLGTANVLEAAKDLPQLERLPRRLLPGGRDHGQRGLKPAPLAADGTRPTGVRSGLATPGVLDRTKIAAGEG